MTRPRVRSDPLRNLVSTLVDFSFVPVFPLSWVRHTARVPPRNQLLPVEVGCSSTAVAAVDLERGPDGTAVSGSGLAVALEFR